MYADDTAVYCIGDTVDDTVTSLNKVSSEMSSWCLEPELFDVSIGKVLSYALNVIGSLNSAENIGKDRIEWVKYTRLLIESNCR